MMYIRLLFIQLLLAPILSFSQNADCWECIVSSQSGNIDKTISTCTSYISDNPNSKSTAVAKFVLARTQMEEGKFSAALELLGEIDTKNKLLIAFTTGLQGDCSVELSRKTEALALYEKAAVCDYNSLSTPFFLFKAYQIAHSIGEVRRAQGYLQTIRSEFNAYASQRQIDKYINADIDILPFELPEEPADYTGEKYGIGVVSGKPVDIERFSAAMDLAIQNAQYQSYGQPDYEVDPNAVWNVHVEQLLLEQECSELGLNVHEDEFRSYLFGTNGFTVLPDIANQFTDPETGVFDQALLEATIRTLEQSTSPEDIRRWAESKSYYAERRLKEKYIAVFQYGIFITQEEIKVKQNEANKRKEVTLAFTQYYSTPDDEIKVTDDLLLEYFAAHKNNYKNKVNSTEFSFFDIPIYPSKEDSIVFNKKVDILKAEFMRTENDSLFVIQNSDSPVFYSGYNGTYLPDSHENARAGRSYPTHMDAMFKAAKPGEIVGPYEQDGEIRMAKVLGFNKNLLTARHILIGASRESPEDVAKAKAKVEELMKRITKENFSSFVIQYSEDPGSTSTGGVYSDFFDYEMVPEFSKYATEAPIGEIGYVQTQYGFHIMEVLERKPVKYPILAVVKKTFEASDETRETIRESARNIVTIIQQDLTGLSEQEKRDRFNRVALKEGFFVRALYIEDDAPRIYGFTEKSTEDTIFRFLYDENRKIGDIFEQPLLDENRIIIGQLSSKRRKDTVQLSDVYDALTYDYVKEQKAKMLKEQMKSHGSVAETAKHLGVEVRTASVSLENPMISGVGFEPAVVGAIFQTNEKGRIPKLIPGNAGVFVVQIDEMEMVSRDDPYFIEMLKRDRTSFVGQTLFRALYNRANVINNIRFFQLRIRL